MIDMEQLEQQRLGLQTRLDGEKTQAERNRLGQFATPTAVATDILNLITQGPFFPKTRRAIS